MNIKYNRKLILVILLSYVLSLIVILCLKETVKNDFKQASDHRKTLLLSPKILFVKSLKFNADAIITDRYNLFILSKGNNEIHIFDLTGKPIDSIINKSDSIWRNQQIMDFYVSNNILDIADSKNQLIKSFDFHNQVKNVIKANYKINRIWFLTHDKIIIEAPSSWKINAHFNNFRVIDFGKKTVNIISEFIPNVDYNAQIYDGFFVHNIFGGGFFVNYFYNNITSIDSLGKIKYVVKSIDDVKLPVVKVSELGWSTYEGDVKPINYCATTDNSFIYILSNAQRRLLSGAIANYIDFYHLNNGKYFGSMLLPQFDSNNPSKLCVVLNKMYVTYKNKLVCYSIKKQ